MTEYNGRYLPPCSSPLSQGLLGDACLSSPWFSRHRNSVTGQTPVRRNAKPQTGEGGNPQTPDRWEWIESEVDGVGWLYTLEWHVVDMKVNTMTSLRINSEKKTSKRVKRWLVFFINRRSGKIHLDRARQRGTLSFMSLNEVHIHVRSPVVF